MSNMPLTKTEVDEIITRLVIGTVAKRGVATDLAEKIRSGT